MATAPLLLESASCDLTQPVEPWPQRREVKLSILQLSLHSSFLVIHNQRTAPPATRSSCQQDKKKLCSAKSTDYQCVTARQSTS
ncbi:hypothetical protein Q5P01_017983 [Channa striata]|uniref:Uncharacterized protein n=1 Tax=Channa striata TaxID=64152 RepID=A0AA88M6D7_CHASR|nr:hypothetical protein Q5P01_017983 [Channa striata]